MTTPINAVLLDLGGVVVDVDIHWGKAAWRARTGRSAEDFERVFFLSGVKDAMDIGRMSAEEGLQRVSELTNGEVTPAAARACFNAILRARPPVTALAKQLAAHARVGVLSNTDPVHAQWIQQNCDIADVVQRWVFSFDVREMKPDPPIYQAALDAMDAPAEATLLIDDRADNLAAAAALGIRGIRYQRFEDVRAELRRLGLAP